MEPDNQENVEETFDFERVTNLLALPEDLEIEGLPIWEAIEQDTGITKEMLIDLQEKNVKSNGKPKPLYMVELIDETYIVRPLTQGDQRWMIEMTNQMTAEKRKELELTDGAELPESELIYIEYYVTTKAGTVFPEGFDPSDEELTISTLSWLYTTITNVSGLKRSSRCKKSIEGYRKYYKDLFYTNAYFMGDFIINEAFGYLFEDMEDWSFEKWIQMYAMARVKLDIMPRDALYDEAGNVLAYVTKYDYLSHMELFGEKQLSAKGHSQHHSSDNPPSDYYIDPDTGDKTSMEGSSVPDASFKDGATFDIDPGMSDKQRG